MKTRNDFTARGVMTHLIIETQIPSVARWSLTKNKLIDNINEGYDLIPDGDNYRLTNDNIRLVSLMVYTELSDKLVEEINASKGIIIHPHQYFRFGYIPTDKEGETILTVGPNKVYLKDYSETNWRPILYTTYYNILRQIAIRHGYCLALHGSMVRDMDLIACPWIELPSHPEVMIDEMCEAVGGHRLMQDDPYDPNYTQKKPHGRLPFSIHTGGGTYLDISVMPPHKTINL